MDTNKNSIAQEMGDRRAMVEMRNIKLDKIVLKNKMLAKIGLTTWPHASTILLAHLSINITITIMLYYYLSNLCIMGK